MYKLILKRYLDKIRESRYGWRCRFISYKWNSVSRSLLLSFKDIKSIAEKKGIGMEFFASSEFFLTQSKSLMSIFTKIRSQSSALKKEIDWNPSLDNNGKDFVFPWYKYFPNNICNDLNLYCNEFIFYQNVVSKKHRTDEILLYIKPFLQYCHNTIKAKSYVLEEFKIYLLNNKKILNSSLCSKDIVRVYLHCILKILLGNSNKYKIVTLYDYNVNLMKKHHVVLLDSGYNLFESYCFFLRNSKKPMLVLPVDYNITNLQGGFLDQRSTLYSIKDFNIVGYIHLNINYYDSVNTLQNFPYVISKKRFMPVVQYWIDFYLKSLLEVINRFDFIGISRKKNYFYLELLEKTLKQFFFFLIQLFILFALIYILPENSDNIVLYLPLHIDRIGRMYHHGVFNLTNSIFFRHLLVVLKIKTLNNINNAWKKKISKDLKLIKFESISLKNQNSVLSSSNWLKLQYYNSRINFKGGIVFWDATASMLQIYSILFGDKERAIFSNLSTKKYDPILALWFNWDFLSEELRLLEKWFEFKNNRKFLKTILMLWFYGASDKKIKIEILLLMKEIDLEKYIVLTKKDIKEIHLIIDFILKKIEFSFPLVFNFKKIMEKKKTQGFLEFYWQGNTFKYNKFKSKETTLDFTSLFPEQKEKKIRKRITLETINLKKIDARATNRTILANLFQSIDASVAVEVRQRMWLRYKIEVYSIHDCFGCELGYGSLLKQTYKDVLFETLFMKKINDFFYAEGADFVNLQKKIDLKKKDPIWKDIQTCASDHCLKLE